MQKAWEFIDSFSTYIGATLFIISLLNGIYLWYKYKYRKLREKRVILKLCRMTPKQEVDVFAPLHDLNEQYYGRRDVVLLNEVIALNRLSQFFSNTLGSVMVNFVTSQHRDWLRNENIMFFLGGPSVDFYEDDVFKNAMPKIKILVAGKYDDSHTNDDFMVFDSIDTLSEGFYFEGTDTKKMVKFEIDKNGVKHFLEDYAVIIRVTLESSGSVSYPKTAIILFGHTEIGTCAAVNYFIKRYSEIQDYCEKNDYLSRNFFFCYDVNIRSGEVRQETLKDYSRIAFVANEVKA